MISTFSRGTYRFSTNAIAAKTYAKFQQKYNAHLDSFKKKTDSHVKASASVKKSTQKVYKHPFDDGHHRPYNSVLNRLQSYIDTIGAEQVSPHYENFGMARKDALTFWAGYFILTFISSTPDFSHYASAALTGWAFAYGSLYFWLEGKKAVAMPFLTKFYRKIARLEMNNLETYYAENIQVRIRNLMANAKSQIDFKSLHNEYLSVRNNTILNFLINEQIALKNHLYERAHNILRQAESMENMNQTKIINEVMAETLNSVDNAYSEHKEEIEKEMFRLALEGIAKGKMDYAKDPIMPYIVSTIQKTVQKFSAISPEQQKKLVTLTQEQIEAIRASDARLRDEFLQNEPKIDGTLKSHPNVSKALSKWGK